MLCSMVLTTDFYAANLSHEMCEVFSFHPPDRKRRCSHCRAECRELVDRCARNERWPHAPLRIDGNNFHEAFAKTERRKDFQHSCVDFFADNDGNRRRSEEPVALNIPAIQFV